MHRSRILVIDDEPVIGELLREVVEVLGHESRWVGTGEESLTQFKQWRPDLLLLDLMLPDIDGFEVCRQIRSSRSGATPAILMLTGMIAWEDRARGFAVGADRFLTKPFQVQDLMREVESLLAEYRSPRLDGLRREVAVTLDNSSACGEQLRTFRVLLTRSTPLPSTAIDRMADDLESLSRVVEKWSHQHASPQPWHLVCRIFRDRVESTLASIDESARPGTLDALHDLFGVGANSDSLPFPASLADSVQFPDHGSVAVLTKRFPNL